LIEKVAEARRIAIKKHSAWLPELLGKGDRD
jgi:hypothetical protein